MPLLNISLSGGKATSSVSWEVTDEATLQQVKSIMQKGTNESLVDKPKPVEGTTTSA